MTFTEVVEIVYYRTTWLRDDPTYYRVYCIWINFFFATILPFVLLLYFNRSAYTHL